MSDFPHTPSPPSPAPALLPPSRGGLAARRPLAALLIWLALLTPMTMVFALAGPDLLERLAQGEPHPARRQAQDALRINRALLASAAPQASSIFWEARRSPALATSFFLAGALGQERAGHPEEARPWLAAQALARGDREAARQWLNPLGMAAPPLPSPEALDQPDWLEHEALGQTLKRQRTP